MGDVDFWEVMDVMVYVANSRKNNANKNIHFICGISLVLLFGVAFCRSGYINLLNLVGFPLSSLVGFLLYGFLTVICLYKFRVKLPPKYILLAIWMGVGLLETIYRCYSFKSSIISIPSSLLWWLGILCGYLYWKVSRSWLKVIVVLLPFLFTLWMSYYGYSMWIHKLNFGSFTGKIEKVVTSDYSLFDEMHKEIKLSQLKGKYVVLDFWHKYCGVCYSKMPMVENLYKRYRERMIFLSLEYLLINKGKNIKKVLLF